MITIEHGRHAYPTPFGEVQIDHRLDEITLVRLIDAIRDCGLVPRNVCRAVISDTTIVLKYFEIDDDGRVGLDDAGNPIEHTIVAQR